MMSTTYDSNTYAIYRNMKKINSGEKFSGKKECARESKLSSLNIA